MFSITIFKTNHVYWWDQFILFKWKNKTVIFESKFGVFWADQYTDWTHEDANMVDNVRRNFQNFCL